MKEKLGVKTRWAGVTPYGWLNYAHPSPSSSILPHARIPEGETGGVAGHLILFLNGTTLNKSPVSAFH